MPLLYIKCISMYIVLGGYMKQNIYNLNKLDCLLISLLITLIIRQLQKNSSKQPVAHNKLQL